MPSTAPSYPLALRLVGRLAVVVGCGQVGMRKAEGLLAAGARVRLVDPRAPSRFVGHPAVELVARGFLPQDLEDAQLVFAATDAPAVNAQVVAEARRRGLWVNRADRPGEGDFSLPAVLRRGALTLTVATEGGAPGMAAALRDRLADAWGEEWGVAVAVATALRDHVLTLPERGEYNPQVLRFVLAPAFLERVSAGDWPAIDHMLADSFGAEVSLATLGLHPLTDSHDG